MPMAIGTVSDPGQIGTYKPCGVDNLSCPRLNDSFPLECYTRGMLCDGDNFCTGGSDEGENLVALDCELLLVTYIHTYIL